MTLQIAEVHVWTAQVAGVAPDPDSPGSALSLRERERAARFHFEKHRRAFVFAHAFLRDVLSRYLDVKPEQIRFRENPFGKPFLAEPAGHGLQFNMSHSGDVVVVALTLDRQIGIDVEFIRPLHDLETIAESNFTPEERALLSAGGTQARQRAFFTCWTRKEAYIKAIGTGLSMPLNVFNAAIPQGAPGVRLPGAAQAASWWLSDLTAPEGYAAAIAVEDGFDRLLYRRWPTSAA
jgi:4'-phosphopantetheinyl transferase